jgi:hypothetical protein
MYDDRQIAGVWPSCVATASSTRRVLRRASRDVRGGSSSHSSSAAPSVAAHVR